MPNELSIQGVTPVTAPGDPATEAKGEPFVPPTVAMPAAATPLYVNPSLRLDAALGLVVIEFRDATGSITSSIPSQRQLAAYRLHEQPAPNLPGLSGAAMPTGAKPPPDAATGGPAKDGQPQAEPVLPQAVAADSVGAATKQS